MGGGGACGPNPAPSCAATAGKFLPFKTPLGGGEFVDMREDSQFSPAMLLEAVAGHGHTLGLVVDLTKTDRCPSPLAYCCLWGHWSGHAPCGSVCRFYDKAELVKEGVGHYKLKCEG